MSHLDHRALNVLIRSEFKYFLLKCFETLNPGTKFITNWHIDAICEYAVRVMCGEKQRGIISMPPRSLKSEVFTIALPAYILGRKPSTRIAIVAYAKELSTDFTLKIRSIMQTEWYQDVFPETRLAQNLKMQSDDFHTDRHGQIYATSIDGTITGKGYDFIFVDDPLKAESAFSEKRRRKVQNWLSNTLPSRLNNQNEGVITLIQQRLHSSDPVGYLLEKGGWDHFCLPAIAQADMEIPIGKEKTHLFKEGDLLNPEMLSYETLEHLKTALGSHRFSAQYLQSPVPEEGELVPMGSFKRYQTAPAYDHTSLIYQSWDVAGTDTPHSDYSVGTTWIVVQNRYYLLDVAREKLEFAALCATINAKAKEYHANAVLIEKTGVGGYLVQELQAGTHLNIIAISPTNDKVSRMIPCTADIEAGRVIIPEEVFWLAIFERELAAFPNGSHDDQADSMSQFLNWIREKRFEEEEFLTQKKLTSEMLKENQKPMNLKTKSDVALMLWNRRPTK